MNMTKSRKLLSSILCIVLIAAMALFTTGCTDGKDNKETPEVTTESQTEAPQTEEQTTEAAVTEEVTEAQTEMDAEVTVLGEGETEFMFTVTDADGNEKQFEIHTDKTVVGEALMEVGLLEGEDGPYGLYVKKVDGIEADYDKDGTYWAFYIDGEYAMTGVDVTDIAAGSAYSMKVEK